MVKYPRLLEGSRQLLIKTFHKFPFPWKRKKNIETSWISYSGTTHSVTRVTLQSRTSWHRVIVNWPSGVPHARHTVHINYRNPLRGHASVDPDTFCHYYASTGIIQVSCEQLIHEKPCVRKLATVSFSIWGKSYFERVPTSGFLDTSHTSF